MLLERVTVAPSSIATIAIMSSLTSVYQSFLSNPTVAALNDEASFNYITTLTTINSSAAIGKHFAALQKVLRKKEEKVLNAIENTDSLCLEVETTLEFLTGGGAYLPGLEENFLADHIVTFPIVSGSTVDDILNAANGFKPLGPYRTLRCKSKDSDRPPALGSRVTP